MRALFMYTIGKRHGARYFHLSSLVTVCALLLGFSAHGLASDCSEVPDLNGIKTRGWGIDPLNQRFQPDSRIDASSIADLVVAGGLDGRLQAFDASSGEVLWSCDSWRTFPAVNAEFAQGGPIDVHGQKLRAQFPASSTSSGSASATSSAGVSASPTAKTMN